MTRCNKYIMEKTTTIQGSTLLSRTECSALRGIAIIGIFLHNYLHWLGPMVKENEYQFHQGNTNRMMELMANPTCELPLQLFSFLGHYGVPVFLFLSGYGLVLKYENAATPQQGNERAEGVWQFMKNHFMKLFPMMVLGFTVFAMVDRMTPGRHHWAWTDIVAQLTMTINLLPTPDRIIWPGPYWFFGLMMQLYLLYRVVLYKRGNGILLGCIALCWAAQALCFGEPEGETLNRIRYNCIGGVLPFGMGILLARAKTFPTMTTAHYIAILVLSASATMLFSLNFHSWLWVPVFIVTANVAFVKLLPTAAMRMFDWIGVLSAAIFVCHPITRKIFIPISRRGDIMDGLTIYIVATVMLAVIFNIIIKGISHKHH